VKFLIIQENGRHIKNRDFRECFSFQRSLLKNGCQCDVWGKGHENYNQMPNFNSYDVIIDMENYDTGWVPSLLNIRAYKIIWSIDAHVRGMQYYTDKFKKNHCQLILQATQDFLTHNYMSIWFPNCFDNTLIEPRETTKRADIGFCGNIVNRQDYLNFLSKNFNFKSDIFVIGKDMVNAINSYKVHFNKNIGKDVNYRNFETIGCRIPLVTDYNSQYAELGFFDGINCMIYKSLPELKEKITILLSDEKLRNNIALEGYNLSKLHTYDVRVAWLLKYLREKI